MTGMAVETGEYRKRLLAQGCDEGLADAVLALVGEARDDAVAEAIARTGEQVKTSDQVLGERLNGHVGKTEGQFNSLMSTIRGTASDLTTMFERRFTQLSERISKLEVDVKGEIAEVKDELGGRIEGVKDELNGRIDAVKDELGGRIDAVKDELAELRGELAELRGELKAQKAENEARQAQILAAIHRAAFGLGMLIIGVAGVLTGLAAAGVFG